MVQQKKKGKKTLPQKAYKNLAAAFFEKKKIACWFGISTALAWVSGYYVYLVAFDVGETAAFLWLPALAVIVIGHLARRTGVASVLVRNIIQSVGLLIYFLPMYRVIIVDKEPVQHILFLVGAAFVLIGALRMKNRWIFHCSLFLIVLSAITLLVQVVKFGGLPPFAYFGIASILLLGIGVLFEKNLNALIRRQYSSMKKAYQSFFEEWE
jgi:hypothetical protein